MIYKIKWCLVKELGLRILLWLFFIWLDYKEPFIREIHESEIWMYQNPVTSSFVPAWMLWLIIVLTPALCFLFDFIFSDNLEDVRDGFLGISLAYCLNGVVTTYLKLIVGRPRPDFYFRCFPDGKGDDYNNCVGERRQYMDGRKSFPSGHASFSFTCMLFCYLYLARKFQLFENKRGQAWQLCVCLLPLLVAFTIAVSRTCDYHHHYEDVAAGSLIGSVISYLCFKLYFPTTITTQ